MDFSTNYVKFVLDNDFAERIPQVLHSNGFKVEYKLF